MAGRFMIGLRRRRPEATAYPLPERSEQSALAHVIYKAWQMDGRWYHPLIPPPAAFFWAEIAARAAIAHREYVGSKA